MAGPQPLALQASTRTTQSPWSATVIPVSEDVDLAPSFSACPGPATRQRTQ